LSKSDAPPPTDPIIKAKAERPKAQRPEKYNAIIDQKIFNDECCANTKTITNNKN
jgi:hypothetical protein